jgi:hypothetical protein
VKAKAVFRGDSLVIAVGMDKGKPYALSKPILPISKLLDHGNLSVWLTEEYPVQVLVNAFKERISSAGLTLSPSNGSDPSKASWILPLKPRTLDSVAGALKNFKTPMKFESVLDSHHEKLRRDSDLQK